MNKTYKTYNTIIIGAGLSGLSLAWFLFRQNPNHRTLLLEKEKRVGGAVRTYREEGFLIEGGPHGFLDNCPESINLLKDIGLDHVAQQAPLELFSRYICKENRLHRIPLEPFPCLRTKILGPLAKFRLLADLWKKPLSGEPSVKNWAEYRFGTGILPLVDAALTGTFSGDPERIKIDAIMPGLRHLERQHGSVLMGLFKKELFTVCDKQKSKKPPAMQNFPEGMEQLTLTLIGQLLNNTEHCDLRSDYEVRSFCKHGKLWKVIGPDNVNYCNNLVFALPVNAALHIINKNYQIPPSPITALPTARIVNVALGYPDTGQFPAGFGYLAPEQEKRFALGAMFSNNMFPGRSPRGHVLLEVLVGGRRHLERVRMDDGKLLANVLRDISQLLPISGDPVFSKIIHAGSGIPQLEDGYLGLLEWQKRVMVENPGLHICGSGWGGIGINDMIIEARRTVDSIISDRIGNRDIDMPESIYF